MCLPFLGCSQSDSCQFPLIVQSEGIAEIGKPAPNFSWIGQDNVKHSLSDYLGKPIIIATWDRICDPCIKIVLPYLADNYDMYSSKGVVILTINNLDNCVRIVDFAKDKNYPFTMLRDVKQPEYKFRSPYLLKQANPYIVLINKKGVLIDIKQPVSEDDINNSIIDLLNAE
jgi:peroxiredoxin